SIRLLFPLLASSLFRVVASLVIFALVLLPLAIAIEGSWLTILVAIGIYIIWAITYGIYTSSVWSKVWWLGALLWPTIIVQEAALTIISTAQHLTGSVKWKGRS